MDSPPADAVTSPRTSTDVWWARGEHDRMKDLAKQLMRSKPMSISTKAASPSPPASGTWGTHYLALVYYRSETCHKPKIKC